MALYIFLLGSFFFYDVVADEPHAYLEVFNSNIENMFSAPFYDKDSYGNSLNHRWLVSKSVDEIYAHMVHEEMLCRQKYHMTLQVKKQMQKLSYDDFVQALLGREDLSDQDKWDLWHDYSDKRWWNWSNEKFESEIQLKEGMKKFHKKQEAKQKKQHQAVVTKYEKIALQLPGYVSVYHEKREQALNQTVEDGGKQHVQTHKIDAQTQAFMQVHGIDNRQFESLSGTIFSHQLFQECADHYKKVASLVYEYGLKNSAIIAHILEFTKTAFIGTEYEQFVLAAKLSDVAEILSDISVGACKGVIKYGANVIDVARDPKQLVIMAQHLSASLVRVCEMLGGALVSYDQESVAGIVSLQACQQAFGSDIVLFNQACDAFLEQFNQWYQKSSVQDKAQAASEVITDLIVTPFMVGKAMKACGGILMQAQEAVNFARAMELAEELGFSCLEAEELLLATEAGVQKFPATAIEIETAATCLMESEVGLAKNSSWFKDVHSVQSFVENIKNIRLQNAFYKNNFLQKETIKYFEQYVYEQKFLDFYKDIEKTHSIMMVEYEGLQVEMTCKPKHLIFPGLDFKTSTKYQKTEAFISGGHAALGIQKLQENNLIKVILQENLFGGCKGLEIEHVFGKRVLDKSIWPLEWTAEQIMKSIKEAWSNPIFFKETIKDELHFLRIVGIDKSGIKVEMFLNKLSAKKFKLKTAYPYWESKAGLNL